MDIITYHIKLNDDIEVKGYASGMSKKKHNGGFWNDKILAKGPTFFLFTGTLNMNPQTHSTQTHLKKLIQVE